MNPFQKVIKKLSFKLLKPKVRTFSHARDLNVLRSEKRVGVEKFLATSPEFMQKYGDQVSVAWRLIRSNVKRLKMGEVIEEKGFEIKKNSTGKEYKGRNTELALSVSYNGKVCFVKLGSDSGHSTALGYQKAKALFESKHNSMYGFRVEVVPHHLLYLRSSVRSSEKGFLVSDFFPSDKVTLVRDIESLLGMDHFKKTPLGQALSKIKSDLSKLNIYEVGAYNCFFDELNKTIYFFDMRAGK